jgi:RNA polymerase sigma-70 factor (ECF subfamily)
MAVMTSTAVDARTLPLAAAAAGDEVAFAQIVTSYHEDMRRVCVVVCGDESIAEEAVASAWTIAWRKLGSVRDPLRLRPWLVSVSVNEARQILRSRRRRAVVEVDIESRAARPTGDDPASGIPAMDLRNALARLDPADRALIAMRYVAGLDSDEIALATGRSPSGARARISRLLDRLERELG